jgi:acyl transferase domain-containing protein
VLERGIIPANIWFERINPKIDAEAWNLVFPTEQVAWPVGKTGLRRASVNSFGFGGTNAHCVLDDAYHYLSSHGLDGRHCTMHDEDLSSGAHFSNGDPQGWHSSKGDLENSHRRSDTPEKVYQEDSHLDDDSAIGVSENGSTNGHSEKGVQSGHDHLENGSNNGQFEESPESVPESVPENEAKNTLEDGHLKTDLDKSDLKNGLLHNGHEVVNTPSDTNLDAMQRHLPEEITQILTLSAFDEAGIERLSSTLLKSHMKSRGTETQDLEDVAYTLNEKRTKLPWRVFASGTSQQPFYDLLFSKPVRATTENHLCYVFTGQGAQWTHMGQALMRFPVFERAIAGADRFFRTALGSDWSVSDVLFKDGSTDINEAQFSQPLCTVLQLAIVDLLTSWGVRPAVVVGHSSGEIAAAYCFGAISRETALRVAYYRGLAVAKASSGRRRGSSMMAVQLSPDALASYLSLQNKSHDESDRVTIACYNSPTNVTVSGTVEGLDDIGQSLEKDGVSARRLKVDVGYHSKHMTKAADIYRDYLTSNWQPEAAKTGPLFVSTVTGSQVSAQELQTPEYWVSNLLNPVRFSEVMSTVFSSVQVSSDSTETFAANSVLEIGPHSTLRSPIRDILKGFGKDINTCYASVLARNQDAFQTVLECIGKLYCSGQQVDLAAFNGELGKKKTPQMLTYLPPYPFNHTQSYWIESRLDQSVRFRKAGHHELLGIPASDWNELEARWNNRLIKKDVVFLNEHKVSGPSRSIAKAGNKTQRAGFKRIQILRKGQRTG